MLKLTAMRTFEVHVNGKWEPALMSQLEPGDVFRMFEPSGELVQDQRGDTTFKVENHPALEASPYIVVEVPVQEEPPAEKPKVSYSAAAEQSHSSFPHRFARGDGY